MNVCRPPLTRRHARTQQLPLLAQPVRPPAAPHAAGSQSIYFEEDAALAGAGSQAVVVAPRRTQHGVVHTAAAALAAAYRRYEAYLLTLGVVFFYLAFTIIQVRVSAAAAAHPPLPPRRTRRRTCSSSAGSALAGSSRRSSRSSTSASRNSATCSADGGTRPPGSGRTRAGRKAERTTSRAKRDTRQQACSPCMWHFALLCRLNTSHWHSGCTQNLRVHRLSFNLHNFYLASFFFFFFLSFFFLLFLLFFFLYTLHFLVIENLLTLCWHRKTQWFFVQCGFYNVAGIALANYSVNYLNYATYVSCRFSPSSPTPPRHTRSRASPQILLRSSRVVATMIGGIFILGKRFMAIEYLGVLLVTAGMVVFSSGDVRAAKAGTEFSSLIIGVVLNIGSLAMNSFQDNYQEKGLHAMRLSENDMVRPRHALAPLSPVCQRHHHRHLHRHCHHHRCFSHTGRPHTQIRFTYAYGTLLLVPVLLVNGELFAAIRFLVANQDLLFLILVRHRAPFRHPPQSPRDFPALTRLATVVLHADLPRTRLHHPAGPTHQRRLRRHRHHRQKRYARSSLCCAPLSTLTSGRPNHSARPSFRRLHPACFYSFPISQLPSRCPFD